MFGKHFTSMYNGSMYGAGVHVFAVWGYVIANVIKSHIEINPNVLAHVLGTDPTTVQAALDFLTAPDPRSRNPDHEGRRLVKLEGFAYYVPSHDKYRLMLNEEDRRAYFRQKKQEQRQRQSKTVKDCPGMSNMSTHTEADTEAEAKDQLRAPVGAMVSEGHGDGSQPPTRDAPAVPPRKKRRARQTTVSPGLLEGEALGRGWVARFGDDWKELTGGIPSYGKIGGIVGAVVEAYGEERARAAWRAFCLSPDQRFGAAYFVEHFGRYEPKLYGVGGTLTAAEIAEISRL